tara:strand:+ start:422 stop:1081 length:660 start_codon:yes stop_codon:yes gene_type:complete
MLDIIYEDNHLIAINKKAGDIVQADKTGDAPLSEQLKNYIKKKYNKPGNVFLGVIHRIDRPTSGVVVFAKTSKSLSRMNLLFRNNQIKKTYWAIVSKAPPKESEILENYLIKNNKLNKSFVSEEENAKKGVLKYKLVKNTKNFFLLKITPKTGRHHQIRVQLSNIGCIIKGDLKYGAKRSNKDKSICLHAKNIEFFHPVKKQKIIINATLPNSDIWQEI